MSATWTTAHTPAELTEVPRVRHALLAVLLSAAAGVVAVGLLGAALAPDVPSHGAARSQVAPVPLDPRDTPVPASLLRLR